MGPKESRSASGLIDKSELVCHLRGVTDLETVILLKLTDGAFSVYKQLSEEKKKDAEAVKKALISAFSSDMFLAYEQFTSRRLKAGEAVDVYLADLRNLSDLFDGLSEKALTCAFVAGLPDAVRQLLRASARIESLTLEETLARTRAVMKKDYSCVSAVAVAAKNENPGGNVRQGKQEMITCYECGEFNHIARDCVQRKRRSNRSRDSQERTSIKCFRCNGFGHRAASCAGNEQGEKSRAPVSSPKRV